MPWFLFKKGRKMSDDPETAPSTLTDADQVDDTSSIRQLQAEHRVKASPELRAMRWITDLAAQPRFVIGMAVATPANPQSMIQAVKESAGGSATD
jgi:hypothetical protein